MRPDRIASRSYFSSNLILNFLQKFAAVALLCCSAGLACAQGGEFPSRPLKLMVPFQAGGAPDVVARVLAQSMSTGLAQPIVIDNKPGANGIVGTEAAANATPDGYTLVLVDRGTFGINPSLYDKLPYDPLKSFDFIGIAALGPYLLLVNPALGVGSIPELVAAAKRNDLRYGSFGVGGLGHINVELIARHLGIKLDHVPYKGGPAALAGVVSGEVALAVLTPPAVLGQLRDGKLRALAVGADKRLELLPSVPTAAEAGLSPEALAPVFFGLAAPRGTPAPILARLSAEMKRALQQPDVLERFNKSGLVMVGGSPDAMARTIATDVERFGNIVRASGIKPE